MKQMKVDEHGGEKISKIKSRILTEVIKLVEE
jgi:hypothetical protein